MGVGGVGSLGELLREGGVRELVFRRLLSGDVLSLLLLSLFARKKYPGQSVFIMIQR